MYIYANNFTLAVSENKNEYMLSFRQVHPVIDEQGLAKGTETASAAEIVMSMDGFQALRSLLNDFATVE